MGTNRWVPFVLAGPLPAERRDVLLSIPSNDPCLPARTAVGYLRYAAGDLTCPHFIIPGVGGVPTYWNDCLPEDFKAIGDMSKDRQRGFPAFTPEELSLQRDRQREQNESETE